MSLLLLLLHVSARLRHSKRGCLPGRLLASSSLIFLLFLHLPPLPHFCPRSQIPDHHYTCCSSSWFSSPFNSCSTNVLNTGKFAKTLSLSSTKTLERTSADGKNKEFATSCCNDVVDALAVERDELVDDPGITVGTKFSARRTFQARALPAHRRRALLLRISPIL